MTENINKKLDKYFKKRKNNILSPGVGYMRASVALILKNIHEQLYILFIKRTENPKDSYSGHVALPGGKMSKKDKGLIDTAVRGTLEEVGIDLYKYGTSLGRLDDLKPLNSNGPKFIVSPFVFILNEDINPQINNDEVEEYIWISFEHLKNKNNMRIRLKKRGQEVVEDYVYNYQKFLIWGMTGKIINSFTKEVSVII